MGYYGKEKEPKGVTASDRTGEKKVGASKVDREMGGVPSMTGAKAPKGATSSDMSGERKARIEGGVGMGKMDGIGGRESSHMGMHDGRLGEMKGGSSESTVYEHKRVPHVQDGM
jgi:hypothetical protein